MPALPLDEAGKYVAAAYLVFLALLLVYVAIMATRLGRMERELTELSELALHGEDGGETEVPASVADHAELAEAVARERG